jgi:MarR family transcriptional regulator, organic hydroperoxide resistance regulator
MDDIQSYIGFLLIQIMKAHRSLAEQEFMPLGLYVGQEMVLLRLWEEDGLTLTRLSEQLGVEPPTVTKMIERMSNAGLVEKRKDEHDARVSRVYLTDQSRALETSVKSAWQNLESVTLQGLSEVELALLKRMLRQILQNLTKAE